MIPIYPESAGITLEMKTELHRLFQTLCEGLSEFTFANLYILRGKYGYRISRLEDDRLLLTGLDKGGSFFALPFGPPGKETMLKLFKEYSTLKFVSESQVQELIRLGCSVREDRDNFDYLYSRRDLSELAGKKFHKKRNLVNAFLNNYAYEGKPLTEEHKEDAFAILEKWREKRADPGDYHRAREALEKSEELGLCGALYYADGYPAAYTLGEEIARGRSFVIHFEKALTEFKGLYQFINKAFASILPEKYETINREQDIGDEGLRQAKMTYRPTGFVKKYLVEARN